MFKILFADGFCYVIILLKMGDVGGFMENFIMTLSYLAEINSNKMMAGVVACSILGGVLLICALALIFKKILLNRKYKADEEFVKEYRKKMNEKEELENKEDKTKDLMEGI